MSDPSLEHVHDLLIIGAGPTGIAIGAAARNAGLDVLLVDRGALTAAILDFPDYMTFFTTRDKLEIADIPFAIPDEKPTRQQALAYYRAVAAHYRLPLALHEQVLEVRKHADEFCAITRHEKHDRKRRARAVALATGYYNHPKKFDLPGANAPWVHRYYKDPYRHFGEDVVLIGGGNSACEAALDLWRNRARSVALVVKGPRLIDTIKYWVRPDVENRIAEGAITAHYNSTVLRCQDDPRGMEIQTGGKRQFLKADAVYALIGYLPDAEFERHCGIQIDPDTLVPVFDPESCESNVPGLYVAGTLQAGRDTGRIFIENSREHAPRIVEHLVKRLRAKS